MFSRSAVPLLFLGLTVPTLAAAQSPQFAEIGRPPELTELMKGVEGDPAGAARARDARKTIQVIFLPGIPGSRLTIGEKIVWGKDKANAKEMALRDPESTPLASAEVLSAYDVYNVHKSDVYGNALDNLEVIATSAYGGLVRVGYDWRQDVGRLADDFNDRLKALDPDRQKQFILVAHSFGGVVAWAWQQKYGADDNRVRHLILLGSPLKGSCEVARTLLEGYQGAIPREAPNAPGLFLDWLQKLFRNVLTGDLRAAAFTFPSTFEILPRFPDGQRPAGQLDQSCLVNTTANGIDVPVDFLSSAFWRSASGRAAIGDAWKEVGDATLDVFLNRLDRVLRLAQGFKLDLGRAYVPITYFYSSDYPTTQKILLPNSRIGRDKALFLPVLGDGRVPFGTILDSCGVSIMKSIRVTEKHGDLPKSPEFERQISQLLPAVADALVVERVLAARADPLGGLAPAAQGLFRRDSLLKELQALIGPSTTFATVAARVRER